LGTKINEADIVNAKIQTTKIPPNSTIKIRTDGIIEFEANAGLWLQYGGVLPSGPAASLKGEWRIIQDNIDYGKLVINKNFIYGLSKISKNIDVTPGNRIQIAFNTWTREAKINKVVKIE